MNRDDTEGRITQLEAKVAAYVRQFLRAHEAKEAAACREAAPSICSALSWLLGARLELAPTWNSGERWIDCLIGARFEVEPPDRLNVRGHMVRGLVEDAGGPQWVEPFEAEVRLGGPLSYVLRFADARDRSRKLLTIGFYQALAGPDHPAVCRPFPVGEASPVKLEQTGRANWVYNLRGKGMETFADS
jgi:hypothetical protein